MEQQTSPTPLPPKQPLTFIAGVFAGMAVAFFASFLVLVFVRAIPGVFGAPTRQPVAQEGANQPVNPAPQQPVRRTPLEIARTVGIDESAFTTCTQDSAVAARVEADVASGEKAGAQGTPYSVIITGNKKYVLGGALPIQEVKKIIDALLAGKTPPESAEVFPQTAVLEPITKDDAIRGEPKAPIAIIEYSDLECPFCKRFHTTLTQILKDYEGKVSWAYRHFPLTQIHDNAQPLAIGAECAKKIGGNDAFWKFIDEAMVE